MSSTVQHSSAQSDPCPGQAQPNPIESSPWPAPMKCNVIQLNTPQWNLIQSNWVGNSPARAQSSFRTASMSTVQSGTVHPEESTNVTYGGPLPLHRWTVTSVFSSGRLSRIQSKYPSPSLKLVSNCIVVYRMHNWNQSKFTELIFTWVIFIATDWIHEILNVH
jgi:hypothetical protein